MSIVQKCNTKGMRNKTHWSEFAQRHVDKRFSIGYSVLSPESIRYTSKITRGKQMHMLNEVDCILLFDKMEICELGFVTWSNFIDIEQFRNA